MRTIALLFERLVIFMDKVKLKGLKSHILIGIVIQFCFQNLSNERSLLSHTYKRLRASKNKQNIRKEEFIAWLLVEMIVQPR